MGNCNKNNEADCNGESGCRWEDGRCAPQDEGLKGWQIFLIIFAVFIVICGILIAANNSNIKTPRRAESLRPLGR